MDFYQIVLFKSFKNQDIETSKLSIKIIYEFSHHDHCIHKIHSTTRLRNKTSLLQSTCLRGMIGMNGPLMFSGCTGPIT